MIMCYYVPHYPSHLSTRESEEEATPSQLTRQEDPSRHLRVSLKLISRALRQPCVGRNHSALPTVRCRQATTGYLLLRWCLPQLQGGRA